MRRVKSGFDGDDTALGDQAQAGRADRDHCGEQGNFDAGDERLAPDGKIDAGDFVALERDNTRLRPAQTGATAGPNGETSEKDNEGGNAQGADKGEFGFHEEKWR